MKYLNNFGDYDVFVDNEKDEYFVTIFIKYHDNVKLKNKMFFLHKEIAGEIYHLSNVYDNANSMDEKNFILENFDYIVENCGQRIE